MTDWDGWEVVCVERNESESDADCRSLSAIGHVVANTLRTRGVDTIHAMIDSELSRFYVDVDGEPRYLQPAIDDGTLYVRTLDADEPTDPILSLPECSEYETPWD